MQFVSFGPYSKSLLFVFRRKAHVSGEWKWTMSYVCPDENFLAAASAVLDEMAVLYRLPARHSCSIRFGEHGDGKLALEIRQPSLSVGGLVGILDNDPPPPPPPRQLCPCEGGHLFCDFNATPDCTPNNTTCLPTHGGPGGPCCGSDGPPDDEKAQEGPRA